MAFFGMLPPWLQGMQSGMGQAPMTPGAGMPPQSNAPMNMQVPQMPTPQVAQGAPMPSPQGQQGQQPIGPAQMGMLSQMLASQTGKPNIPMPSAQGMEGVIEGMPGADAQKYIQGLNPGLLARLFSID